MNHNTIIADNQILVPLVEKRKERANLRKEDNRKKREQLRKELKELFENTNPLYLTKGEIILKNVKLKITYKLDHLKRNS